MYKYQHGGDVYSSQVTAGGKAPIDFSANINPLGLPPGVKRAVQNALKNCINYPDPFCRELRTATAAYLGVKEDCLFFGNGAADVLFRLALALKPHKALLLAPTFADYEKALRSVDCKINYYELQERYDFKVRKSILSAITPNTDLVVICNPNNPTGQLTNRRLLLEILNKCVEVNARLLIDECFMDFVDEEKSFSMRDLLLRFPNLIILKAFTKTFAMPGIRLGYCLTADAELQRLLHECGQDWSVSVLAQAAGKAALMEKEYLHETALLIREERQYLLRQLQLLGAVVYGSEANYIFFKLDQPKELVALMREQGYLIRSCANYHNLGEGYYRIAVKTRVLNRSLIKTMKGIRKNALLTDDN
ncbi:MAG: aminotransferase class I/II-fold pyridoxal phosphate-dependent enzyme [Phascolarctobacterium sp.]|nr:aminotransferase class I/II-fold pyridoxal phosphate-dependent enzyme [Phascolarctobacterium sp.]